MKSTQVVFRFDFVTVPEGFFWFNNYKAGKKEPIKYQKLR
jgi:hypothetical protein